MYPQYEVISIERLRSWWRLWGTIENVVVVEQQNTLKRCMLVILFPSHHPSPSVLIYLQCTDVQSHFNSSTYGGFDGRRALLWLEQVRWGWAPLYWTIASVQLITIKYPPLKPLLLLFGPSSMSSTQTQHPPALVNQLFPSRAVSQTYHTLTVPYHCDSFISINQRYNCVMLLSPPTDDDNCDTL